MTMLKAIVVIALLSAIISGALADTEDGAEVSEPVQARSSSCQGFLASKLLLLICMCKSLACYKTLIYSHM